MKRDLVGHEHERGRPSSRYYKITGGLWTPRAHAGFKIARSCSGHVDSLAPTLVQVGMKYGRDSREATALNVDKFFGDVASPITDLGRSQVSEQN